MNTKTISAVAKSYENRDGKCYLYDKDGQRLAEFDGDIQESNSSLYVVQNKNLYCIILKDGEYVLEKY